MARPVAYITTPRSSYEEQVRKLGIPKARQKVLLKIMEETRQQADASKTASEESLKSQMTESEEKAEIASASR